MSLLPAVDIDRANSDRLKTCCAQLYESQWASLLLGDSFHPGGLALTGRLGELVALRPRDRVLDLASGHGTSAIYLAQRFGCQVVGLDYGRHSVARAQKAAAAAGVSALVSFQHGDAEHLPFADGEFDALICECAFCTFPNKRRAGTEMSRVLKARGRLGMSDLTRNGTLPPELDGLLAWISCIADARPVDSYISILQTAGLSIDQVEIHNEALSDLVQQVRARLLGAELLISLKKVTLPGAEFERARRVARLAAAAVRQGKLGYALLVGRRPAATRA